MIKIRPVSGRLETLSAPKRGNSAHGRSSVYAGTWALEGDQSVAVDFAGESIASRTGMWDHRLVSLLDCYDVCVCVWILAFGM